MESFRNSLLEPWENRVLLQEKQNMNQPGYAYINRDISWLSFNERVLQEAQDKSVPLLERIRFLGIYSNNRDEFFRVRIATIRRMTKLGKKALNILGEDPETLLNKIQRIIVRQQSGKFDQVYKELVKELETHNIFISNETQLNEKQQVFVKEYFNDVVFPALFPVMADSALRFPYLKDKPVYLIVQLNKKDKKPKYALIEVPEVLPRFLVLPEESGKKYVTLLDDVIRFSLKDIFSMFDFDSVEAYTIKMTRDADLDLDNDFSKSMVEKITRSLKKRKKGFPVRLTYDSQIPNEALEFLVRKINVLKRDNLVPGGRYHNFKDFIDFPNVGQAMLRHKIPHPLFHKELKAGGSSFKVIGKKDVLLCYPYQSFTHIIDFLREASIDPKVQYIKITLYRAAKNSSIVNALINAVKNGKHVTVVVELQARFDEEANLFWANALREEGAKVIYGAVGLKVHSKLLLIGRKEGGEMVRYAHVGTGNFNEATARVYTDMSLLTADKRITEEVEKVFEFYSDNRRYISCKHLLVSPFSMRRKIVKLINGEINNAKTGKEAWIILKLNSLSDREIISRLYEASRAGVKIKLIVRGICSLVPGIKGLSDNIEAISIVDKYLEHSRVFIFCNAGEEKYYISSADIMTRNLDHRSEVAVPVYSREIQKTIRDMIDIQWNDNTKARIINEKQNNIYKTTESKTKVRSQDEIFRYFSDELKAQQQQQQKQTV